MSKTAAFRRLCVETLTVFAGTISSYAAAFRRLCVETINIFFNDFCGFQPPSGGCVLKRDVKDVNGEKIAQPPSGGCVLKPEVSERLGISERQPPSGGCVLKLGYVCISLFSFPSRLQAAVC